MTKARIIAAAIAALVVAPATYAQDAAAGGAWNSQYGLIFTVQNVFQNSSDAVIGDYGGGIGVQKNLSPQRALRVSVNLSRASDSGYVTENTDLVTGDVTKSYTYPGTYTSRYNADLSATYVMRLTSAKIAPYLGVGGGVNYLQSGRKFDNDTSTTTTYSVNDMYREASLFASGTLGLEWRVHSAISLFAEYGLGIGLVTYESDKTESKTTSNATGAVLSGDKSSGSTTRFLTWGTGLGQGGQLGLVAFF